MTAPKGKSGIVKSIWDKLKPKPPTPRDKALGKYTKGSGDYEKARRAEDRIDAQKASLSPAERKKIIEKEFKGKQAREAGAPPLQRRPASYKKAMRDENVRGTGSAYPSTPTPVKQPREPVRRDALNEPLPDEEFDNLFKQAWGERVPNWQVLKKEAEGYGWVVPENPKDVLEHNRLMKRILQQRKHKRQRVQEILSGDPEKAKAELEALRRGGADVALESPMPEHLAASTKTDELGRMVPDRPPIKHDAGKVADDLYEARRKQFAAAEAKRMTTDQIDETAELLRVTNPTPTPSAPIRTEVDDPFAKIAAEVEYLPPRVFVQGTGGSRKELLKGLAKDQPTISLPVEPPKKMSKKKKVALGALIGSPAVIPFLGGGDEDSESPKLPEGFTQDDYKAYLKAAEEAAAKAAAAAAKQPAAGQ